MEKNAFYLVWNPSTGYTMFRHESRRAAEIEAERLCRQHNGEFIVLEAQCSIKKSDIVKTNFIIDPIPF